MLMCSARQCVGAVDRLLASVDPRGWTWQDRKNRAKFRGIGGGPMKSVTCRTSDARARWVFMRIKEWKAEHIRWATFPHVRCIQRCNRRVIHKGECHFTMRRRVRCAKCAHNECGEFG